MLAFLVGGSARAQSDDDDRTTPHRLRLRDGISFISGFVDAPFRPIAPATTNVYMAEPTVLGVALRLGIQFTDQFAVFYQATGTSFWMQWRNAFFVEWTPVDYFSVGVGPAVDLMTDIGTANWGAGAALRLALHVPFIRKPWGRRDSWTLGVDVTPAYAFTLEPGLADGFQVGVMGSVGIEFY